MSRPHLGDPLGELLDTARRIIARSPDWFPSAGRPGREVGAGQRAMQALAHELSERERAAMKCDLRGRLDFAEYRRRVQELGDACRRLLYAGGLWREETQEGIRGEKDPEAVANSQAHYAVGCKLALGTARTWLADLWTQLRVAGAEARETVAAPGTPPAAVPGEGTAGTGSPPAGQEHDPYVPASEIVRDYPAVAPNVQKLRRILKKHQEIRTRKPAPQRLTVHLLDWHAYVKSRQADPYELLDQYGDEVQKRQAEIRAEKERRGEKRGRQ